MSGQEDVTVGHDSLPCFSTVRALPTFSTSRERGNGVPSDKKLIVSRKRYKVSSSQKTD